MRTASDRFRSSDHCSFENGTMLLRQTPCRGSMEDCEWLKICQQEWGCDTMAKRLVVFILILGIMLGGSGCMSIFGKPARVRAEEMVIAYLEEKYGEDFTAAGTYGERTSNVEMYVTCESLPGKKIHVYADDWTGSNPVIHDNYLMYKYSDEIVEYIQKQLSKEFQNTKIHWAVVEGTLSPDLPGDATMEQVLKDDNAKLYAQVDVMEGELTSMEQLSRVMECIKADVNDYEFVFVCVEKDNFGKLTGQELISRYNDEEMVCGAVFCRLREITRETWREPKE